MILNNTSLSGINISKTYDNVLHLECYTLETLRNTNNAVFNIYDGGGTKIPVSYSFTSAIATTPNNNATTIYFENVVGNTIPFKNTNISANTTNCADYKYTGIFETNTLFHYKHLGTPPINTVILSKISSPVANIEYLYKWAKQLKFRATGIVEKNTKNKDVLVLAYYNNAQGSTPQISFDVSADDLVYGKFDIVVFYSVDVYYGNRENHHITLEVQGPRTTYTRDANAMFYVESANCYSTRGDGSRTISSCEAFTVSNPGKYIIKINTNGAGVYYNSMVVLNGKQFTR